jgi:3-hydroxy acid dehydrogenase/malonic semialdehyde reductase
LTDQSIYRSALVSGASKGIGNAIVTALRARSMEVHALARSQSALETLAQTTGCIPHALDVSSKDDLKRVMTETDFDVLIANAGVQPSVTSFQQMDWDDIEAMIDINVKATMRTVHMALPTLLEKGYGHIFVMGSVASQVPFPSASAYCATKAAIHMFCRALRCDLLGTQIKVTEIMPGRVETALYHNMWGEAGAKDKLYSEFKALQPEDIATALLSALDTPSHVDVSHIEVMPQMQTVGGSSTYAENHRG